MTTVYVGATVTTRFFATAKLSDIALEVLSTLPVWVLFGDL